jgi:hypothetical protein
MKVVIVMGFILLVQHLINVSLFIVISCEDLILHLSLVTVCTKIIIPHRILQQQGCILSLLIKFDNTSQKGKKNQKAFS